MLTLEVTTTTAPKSAAAHTPAELTFIEADDITGIVHFRAASRHEAGRINVVGLDTTTGAIACDCKAAQCGRACWHVAHVTAAWLASPAMLAVRWLTADQLMRYGKKHATLTAIYRTRIDRALADDMTALVAARCEFRKRAALAMGRFQLGTGTANAIAEGEDVVLEHVATRALLPIRLLLASDFPHDPSDGAALAA